MLLSLGHNVLRQLGEKLIWRLTLELQTVIGNKIRVHRNVRLNITFGNTTYHHDFKLNFKNNELHSMPEDLVFFKTKNPEIKSVHKVII